VTDAVVAAPHRAWTIATSARRAAAAVLSVFAVVREWRRRARSRAELAMYSQGERADLGYAAELDAEIGKPFWRR
jgi:uncharacterized protein YjiS (DUF1127 family)